MTTTYAYDALGQLVRVDDPHENATWVYEYDRGGNMTKRKKYAYTTGSLDGLSYSLRSYTYDSTWKDLLVSNGSYPLTYDAMGNLSTYADWVYEWEGGRQLVKQTQNEKVVSYKYDHNGMRVSKTYGHTNGAVYAVTNYVYNGTKLVHMKKNSDILHFFYDNQGRPAKVSYNDEMYTYLHNLQGDIVGIVDGNGTLVVEYKYNAWGTILSKSGSLVDTLGKLNPFRYRGYIFDEETWMYWLKSRYYYPELYRFINADVIMRQDGILLTTNQFIYCSNSVTINTDSSGMLADECTHVYFKNTYYIRGNVFENYMKAKQKKYSQPRPLPRIVRSAVAAFRTMVSNAFTGKVEKHAKKPGVTVLDYAKAVISAEQSYYPEMENSIIDDMVYQSIESSGFKSVKVELLYGSHSAEVRRTFLDQNNNIIKGDPIVSQGYTVIADMISELDAITSVTGGIQYHEGVSWKYTMAD